MGPLAWAIAGLDILQITRLALFAMFPAKPALLLRAVRSATQDFTFTMVIAELPALLIRDTLSH